MRHKIGISLKKPVTVGGITYEIKPDPAHTSRFILTVTMPGSSCKPGAKQPQS